MKKVKNLAFLLVLGIVSGFMISNVHAAGAYVSTLNMPYGSIYSGRARNFASGSHKIDISVDGFNTYNGGVITNGATTMEIGLWDVASGRYLKRSTGTYNYGSCRTTIMGNYSAGSKYYTFYSNIGVNYYKGVISNQVLMYPKP